MSKEKMDTNDQPRRSDQNFDFADYFESDLLPQENERSKALYDAALITAKDGQNKPVAALSIQSGHYTVPCGYSRSCILIYGAEKAGKGRLYILIAVAALSGQFGPFKSGLRNRKIFILHSDDHRYALHRLAMEISSLAGRSSIHENLFILSLRTADVLEKKLILHEVLQRHKDVGMIILDLLWDWTDSVNNEVYTKILMDELLKQADENDFLLILVTHQSRVERAPKGHQGAQFASKAQTVFHVKNRKDAFIVNAVQTRGPHINPFAFKYDGENYHFIEMEELSKRSGPAKGDFTKIDDQTHLRILSQLPASFSSSVDLRSKLSEAYGSVVETIGINLVKALVSYYLERNWIRKEGRSTFFRNGTERA